MLTIEQRNVENLLMCFIVVKMRSWSMIAFNNNDEAHQRFSTFLCSMGQHSTVERGPGSISISVTELLSF
jgi:hypothetical protein